MNVFRSDVNKSVTSELIARSGPLWNIVDDKEYYYTFQTNLDYRQRTFQL